MPASPIFAGSKGDASSQLREWSSLIGIVTAIVGNVLISFALNIQRYAHTRLDRGQERDSEDWTAGHDTSGQKSYGTQQIRIAEERANINLNAPSKGEEITKSSNGTRQNTNGTSGREESPHSRISSGSTIRQSEKPRQQDDRKSYLKSPYWWAGILLMICGEAGNFIAYGFAPASIVSPLGVVALVSNCIIAPVLLKEHFRQQDFWGVAIAIAGAVTIVLSAKNSETKMGPNDVWAAITRWEFETYLGITAALIVSLMWASGRYGEKTILIDLGLVGLFGMVSSIKSVPLTDQDLRRLYCSLHKGRCIPSLGYTVAHPDFPYHLPPCIHTCCYSITADTICESRATTVRLDSGHPGAIRSLHHFRHYRKCCPVSRL